MNRKIAALILGIGFLCRLDLSLGRADMFWPDEQFQTLEPASRIIFGHGYQAWEWLRGFRTWLLPAFFTPGLALAKLAGIEAGLKLIHWTRLWMGMLDILSWATLIPVFRRLGLHPATQTLLLLICASLPWFQLWGVSTLQDHMALIMISPVLLAVLKAIDQPLNSSKAFLTGFALGALGWLKIQLGVFAAGIVIANAWLSGRNEKSSPLKIALPWVTGGGAALLVMALTDLFTLGKFGQSTLNQLLEGEKISRFYGTAPWLDGFVKLYELTGGLFWILMIAGLLARATSAFESGESRTQQAGKALALPLAAGALAYISMHILIPHKETRFFLPMLPPLLLLLGVMLDPVARQAAFQLNACIARLKLPRVIPGFALAILAGASGAVGLGIARETPLYLSSTDISDLEDRVARLRPLLGNPNKICLMLVGHNWSWTRGHLILGAEAEYPEWGENDAPPAGILERCELAIVSDSRLPDFLGLHPEFAVLQKGHGRYSLLARKELRSRIRSETGIQSN
jgi:hypothetical protein